MYGQGNFFRGMGVDGQGNFWRGGGGWIEAIFYMIWARLLLGDLTLNCYI